VFAFYLGSSATLPGKSPKRHTGMQPSASKGTCKLPSYSGKLYLAVYKQCNILTILTLL